MTSWLVRVEGVNFDTTVFDTDDLSTVRGGSLALLKLGAAVEAALAAAGASNPKSLYSGASQCAFTFDLPGDEAAVAPRVRSEVAKRLRQMVGGADQPPLAQMTAVIAVVPLDGSNEAAEDAALQKAEARNHTQQFRRWTIGPLAFDATARQADPFDMVRPASKLRWLPHGKVLDPDPDEDKPRLAPPNADRCRLAVSVARRRDYGRRARQKFYCEQLDGQVIPDRAEEILWFPEARVLLTNEFKHLIDRGDKPKWSLPPALENKIAVVYADGNGFGKIREGEDVGVRRFSEEITTLRKRLLAAVLRWYMSGVHSPVREAFAIDEVSHYGKRRLGLRLETLLWGGDELMFVMPAWLVFSFLKGFFAATTGWKIGKWALTHAVGVTIAHYKTPIRQLKLIAAEAADTAKDAGLRDKNSVTFEIFESLAPPDTGLKAPRAATFGTADEKTLARWLALPGDQFDEFECCMRVLKGIDGDDGFPRSQLYDALRAVRRAGGTLTDDIGAKAVGAYLDAYRRRAGGVTAKAELLTAHLPPDWAEPADKRRPMPVALALIAQLWDYAGPFETPLPEFPAAAEQAVP